MVNAAELLDSCAAAAGPTDVLRILLVITRALLNALLAAAGFASSTASTCAAASCVDPSAEVSV